MKKSKLCLLLVCLMFLFSSCERTEKNSTTPESNGVPTLYASTVQTSPGETVEVAVQIKNNPGVLGMTFSIHFDESKCRLVSVKNGDALKALQFTPSKTLENGSRFLWDALELSDGDVLDGEVLVMKFKVSDDAYGYCPITVKAFSGDILDQELNVISPLVQSGEIIINTERN